MKILIIILFGIAVFLFLSLRLMCFMEGLDFRLGLKNPKYRIKESTTTDGESTYVVQMRSLYFTYDRVDNDYFIPRSQTFDTIEDAIKFMNELKDKDIKTTKFYT